MNTLDTKNRIRKEAVKIFLNDKGYLGLPELIEIGMIAERNKTIDEIQDILRNGRGADITFKSWLNEKLESLKVKG
jgi:hypothetical protein